MGLQAVVQGLTTEQIRELAKRDIAPPRVSEWKAGRRKPTLAQAKVLAVVTGASFQELAEELAEMEATPGQRELFRGLTTAAAAVLSVLVLFTLPSESQAAVRASGQSTPTNNSASLYTLCSILRNLIARMGASIRVHLLGLRSIWTPCFE